VVVAGKGPADAFRPVARDGDGNATTGAHDTCDLGHRDLVGGNVLEHLGRHDDVEARVRERERQQVGPHRAGAGVGRRLAGGGHRPEHRGDLRDLFGTAVDGDDMRAAAIGLERVAAETAAQVEHLLARLDEEPGEVNGQHGGSVRRAAAASA
jgi:hypothetical protein